MKPPPTPSLRVHPTMALLLELSSSVCAQGTRRRRQCERGPSMSTGGAAARPTYAVPYPPPPRPPSSLESAERTAMETPRPMETPLETTTGSSSAEANSDPSDLPHSGTPAPPLPPPPPARPGQPSALRFVQSRPSPRRQSETITKLTEAATGTLGGCGDALASVAGGTGSGASTETTCKGGGEARTALCRRLHYASSPSFPPPSLTLTRPRPATVT